MKVEVKNNVNVDSVLETGCVLAMCISWSCYHSVGWAILHGICSWFFVIWWCLFGTTPCW